MKDENSDMSDSSKIENYRTENYEYLPEEMEVLEDRNYSSIFEATGNEGNDLQNVMSDTDYESSFSEKKTHLTMSKSMHWTTIKPGMT